MQDHEPVPHARCICDLDVGHEVFGVLEHQPLLAHRQEGRVHRRDLFADLAQVAPTLRVAE